MNLLLKNKTAIVTGGTRGIGRAIVEKFVEEGAQVAFTYFSDTSSRLAKEMEKSLDGRAKGYQVDASNGEATKAFIEEVLKEFSQIDIAINNAGITKDGLLMRMKEEDWDKVICNNLSSVFHLSKAVIVPMMKCRSGSIINISSIVGLIGNAGQSNYAAAKAGIIGFTKSMAKELGPRNIRCNVIAPGFIQTDMTDSLEEKYKNKLLENIALRKLAQPKAIADACLFLASNLSDYITGEVLNVNGGI